MRRRVELINADMIRKHEPETTEKTVQISYFVNKSRDVDSDSKANQPR